MKRILPTALAIIVLLFAGLLIGPSFMDWNKYKPQIIEQAKSSAGYDVRIDGDIGLSLLPLPQLKIEGLTVLAPRGKEQNLLTMKQANVSVKLWPLLSKDIVVDTVRLVNPDIRVEVLPDGSNSWMSDKLLADQKTQVSNNTPEQGGSKSSQMNSFTLDKLTISDGRVSYVDRRTGKEQLAENIDFDVKVDSLAGPFKANGTVSYQGRNIQLDVKTEKMTGQKKELPVDISIALPDVNAKAAFKGIAAMEPLEIQGKMQVSADNLATAIGAGASPALSNKLAFSGLVTANEQKMGSEDIDITFGDAKGKGSISVSNLKDQNPVQVNADMALAGIINLDQLAPSKDKGKEKSVEERVAKGEKLSASSGLIPDTLSLPFPIDANVKITADGIQFGGTTYKGIVAQISKAGPVINLEARALDIPGKTTAEVKGGLKFATSSASGDKGVIYADPSVSFEAEGSSEQLPTLLRAVAPAQQGNAALEIYKTAQFDFSGSVTPTTVVLSNSSLKLDDTRIALAGSYKPNGIGGRPDIMIDATTDTINIDQIQSRLNGQKKQVVQKDTAAKTDMKKALEPVRNFEMPVNLTFDVSAQNAVFNTQNINGIRIKGKAAGQSLNLDYASVQDYMGAAVSLKGSVANLKELSGIDMTFYGKTSDIKSLMSSFKMDTSKLPQSLSGAEANIAAKGKADALAFDAKVMALNGQLEAAGNMTGLLDKPTFSNLAVGAKHPNFVKAIQIVNPAFTGGPGLERPFDFSAKAVNTNNVYDLTDLKANMGGMTIAGNLKVDTTGTKPSVAGTVQAGNIPLDSLLGAKADSASTAGSGGGASSANAGGGKWSRTTIETGWMHSLNLDLGLSAQSITYGGWNFVKPNTKITLKDGSLLVDNLQAGLFGGDASLSTKVVDPVDPKQPLSMTLQTKMSNVALEPLAFALSGSNKIKAAGDVSLDINVQTTGLSAHALVSGLQGKSNLNGKSVVLRGFDLAQIGLAFVDTGKPMDRLSSIMTGAVNGGETRFDTITGVYDIMQGVAGITSMEMDGPAANIKSKGNVNLPQWTIDTIHTITFKQAKEAGAFDVAIKGSLSNPANTFGKGLFNDVLTRRLQDKALEKLPDLLGKDLGGKLQGLGILPKKQDTVIVPRDGSAPIEPQPESAPAPAEPAAPLSEKEQRKEDGKKAIEGVLKGLLQ